MSAEPLFQELQRVAAGSSHTLVLENSGPTNILWGFGSNRNNQLLLETAAESAQKEFAEFPTDEVFLRNDELRRCIDPTKDKFCEVSCGDSHSAVLVNCHAGEIQEGDGLLHDSTLWLFGNRKNGRCGFGEDEAESITQLQFSRMTRIEDALPIVQRVVCGANHTFAIVNFKNPHHTTLTSAGRLFAWGHGGYGALGTKSGQDEWEPVEVWFPGDEYHSDPELAMRNVAIRQIAAGSIHSVALDTQGSVYTWGFAGNGRLGHGKYRENSKSKSYCAEAEPKKVEMLSHYRVQWVGAGEAHCGASATNLFTWGQGSHGRLGHGSASDLDIPMRVESLSVATCEVHCGLVHTIAVTTKGQLYGCGKGPATGLDVGSKVVDTPRLIELPGMANNPVHQVSVGPLHTVVLMKDGALLYMGSSSERRLPPQGKADRGRVQDQCVPKRIEIKRTTLPSAENTNTFWIPDKDVEEIVAPRVETFNGHDWWPKTSYAGGAHSACVTNDGEVWMWGAKTLTIATDASPQTLLGFEFEDRWVPCEMKKLAKVTQLAVGVCHCLAIVETEASYGSLWSWGDGSMGQLGNGSTGVTVDPMEVVHVRFLTHVAAGEVHSACVVEGGELYMWGCALGGKLGFGTTECEGTQIMPKVCVAPDGITGFKRVECGMQHTAAISDRNALLTCGMGFFGRLGHGTTSNVYRLSQVNKRNFPGALEAHCATYHTCVIDETKMLWMCGQDKCCCRKEGEHALELTLFEPFTTGQKRLIRALATSDLHTLAITEQNELWCWGSNKYGQLGINPKNSRFVDLPFEIRLDIGKRHLASVSTASGHSIVIVEDHVSKKKKKTHKLHKPEVWAWGFNSCGRVGTVVEEDPADEPNDGADRSGFGRATVRAPMIVDGKWAARETKIKTTQPVLEESANKVMRDTGSFSWDVLQQRLWEEPPEKKLVNLVDKMEDMQRQYRSFLNEMLLLWKKPNDNDPGHEPSEWHLRQLYRSIEIEYIRTLQALGLGDSAHGPKLERRSKTKGDLKQKLYLFEKLLWILQQQPTYLANLGQQLTGKPRNHDRCVLFHDVVDRIFADLSRPRNMCLHMAMLRVLVDLELRGATSFEEVLHPDKSRLSSLVSSMVVNPRYVKDIVDAILDPEDDNSLMSIIIRYTVSKTGHKPNNMADMRLIGTTNKRVDMLSGCFASNEEEYAEHARVVRNKRHPEELEKETEADLQKMQRQLFDDEAKDFARLCYEGAGGHVHTNKTIGKFVEDFISKHIMKKENANLQMLFSKIFASLQHTSFAMQFRLQGADDYYSSNICAPLASIVLASIIGGVLANYTNPRFAVYMMKVERATESYERKLNDAWRQSGDESVQPQADSTLNNRVAWNIEALSRFFYRIVHPDMYKEQYKESSHQAKAISETAFFLKERACKTLMDHLAHNRHGSRFAEDTIETALTVNLYESQHDLNKSWVTVSTAQLLEFSNLLKNHMDTNPQNLDMKSICVDKNTEEDPLYKLINEILVDGKCWGVEDIAVARATQESFNFLMQSRFLEFRNTDEDECTFCEISEAPIPRWLAAHDQKHRRGLRCVRPFRNVQKGPVVDISGFSDGVYPFEHLEALIEEVTGAKATHSKIRYPLHGTTLAQLTESFGEMQRSISNDTEEGRATLAKNKLMATLEIGKKMVDKIVESVEARELFQFIDSSMQRRGAYREYLDNLQKGLTGKMKLTNDQYKKDVSSKHKLWTSILKVTRTCDVADAILQVASSYSVRLEMQKAKRSKTERRKLHPTPAQKILMDLVRNSKEGQENDQLRAQAGMPARTFELRELILKGVIVQLNAKLTGDFQKKMKFIIQYNNEEFTIQCVAANTSLRSFVLTREDLALMNAARKLATICWGDGFVWVNTFRLSRLLGFMAADGDL